MRYDVIYSEHRCYAEPHFCREWDEDGGCYGTNPNHGLTWEDAVRGVSRWYHQIAIEWERKPEPNPPPPSPEPTE